MVVRYCSTEIVGYVKENMSDPDVMVKCDVPFVGY